MTDLITRAKSALVGVTDGPWKQGVKQPAKVFFADGFTVANCFHDAASEYRDEANARFIATSRQLVPELIAQAIADKARIEELDGALGKLTINANKYDGVPMPKYYGDIDFEFMHPDIIEIVITLGELRAARAALKGLTP